MLEIALKYLSLGWSIIPVKQGSKLPAISSWLEYQKRQPTTEEVTKWWTEMPQSNIAIVCGKVSGIIVVDLDKGSDRSQLDLPITLVSKTGGGGFHYFYKWREGLVGAKVGIQQKVDIRSDNSYIVAPPSLHQSGNLYEWTVDENEPIVDAPSWLEQEGQTFTKTDWDRIIGGITPSGSRNMTAAQYAGKIIQGTIPSLWSSAFEYFQVWNQKHNVPPLPEKELGGVWNSIMKKHLKGNSIEESSENDNIVFLKSSEIVSKPIDWLWEGRIAKGKVTMIAGDPGLGKSQTTIYLAGVVSNGGEFPGGYKCKQGSVLFFSAEDDPEDTINPRLTAVGANREKIGIFSTVNRKGKEKFFDLSKDIDLLDKALQDNGDVSLIIVDPITAFLGETDSHVNAEVRALLAVLSKMAAKYHIAVVVVTHLNKSSGNNALNKITGSLAFVAAARAAFMVIKDQNDEDRRLFLTVKNNIASDKGGFAFKVEGVEIDSNGNKIRTSKVVWEKESISLSVGEAMRASDDGDKVDKQTVKWLEAFLRQYPDGVSFDIVQKEAARQGISKSTLYRAEKDIFVEKIYNGNRKPKIWKLAFDEGNEVVETEDLVEIAVKNF